MTHTLRTLLLSLTLAMTGLLGCATDTGTDTTDEPTTATAPGVGTAPVPGPDGVPIDCGILYDGLCYQTMNDAAHAAGKDPKNCTILETYPGQLSCKESTVD